MTSTLPPYAVRRSPAGLWVFDFVHGRFACSYVLAPGRAIEMRAPDRGAWFWCAPDREPARTVVPLMLADAWDKGLLT